MIITLEFFEVELAIDVARRRHSAALQANRATSRSVHWAGPVTEFAAHLVGATGELAAAKATGVFWNGSVNTFRHGGDIGPGWQVRTCRQKPSRLWIYEKDRDADVFIAALLMTERQVRVEGWLTGGEVRQCAFQEANNGLPRSWFATPEQLRPITDLIH